jgi:hypothetical protein
MNSIDRLKRGGWIFGCCLAIAATAWPEIAQAVRIKEVASVQGVRSNQLVGYGLVVGLDGTGDSTTSAPFTAQSLSSLLLQMGVTLPAGTQLQVKNVAAVMVTAQLPAFAQPGQSILAERVGELPVSELLGDALAPGGLSLGHARCCKRERASFTCNSATLLHSFCLCQTGRIEQSTQHYLLAAPAVVGP